MQSVRLPLVLLLAVLSAPALAGEEHGDKTAHACPMHDTSLTTEERAKAMDTMFAKLDADGDGRITREEFDRHHEDMRREGEQKHEH